MDSFLRVSSEKPIIARMLRIIIFLFPLLAVADNSVSFDGFNCKPAQPKKGKVCKLFICQGPNGYGIGRTQVGQNKAEDFLLFPVNTQSSTPYIERFRLGVIKEDRQVELKKMVSLLEVPPTIFPNDIKDDFLTYKFLSSKGYYLERDADNLINCDDSGLNKIIADMDNVRNALREKIKNHDYVKVIDVAGGLNVVSRLAPRSRLSSDYCDMGNNTYATKEALKLIEGTEYKEPKGKILSEKEAQKIFNELKDMKDLPWAYTPDGCFARAQIAAERLESKGIAVGKVFYFGDDLWPANLPKGLFDQWSYHVAPFVYVKGNDGKIRRMVLDPASQTAPVESYKFGKSLSRDKDIQVLTTRWAGGADMTGLPVIQMIYTNLDTYLPDKIQATDRATNHKHAQENNERSVKDLEEKKQKRLMPLTK